MSNPSQYLSTLTLYSTKQEIKTVWDELSATRRCLTCDQQYNLLESMGTHSCSQHPGYLQKNGVYSCCGQTQHILSYHDNYRLTSMFTSSNTSKPGIPDYQEIPSLISGCQKCDHNTSSIPWSHTDRKPIQELSAVIPIMFKHGTHLLQRNGFDQRGGVLRRCEVLALPLTHERVLRKPWDQISYLDEQGKKHTKTKKEIYEENEESPVNGMDIRFQYKGRPVEIW